MNIQLLTDGMAQAAEFPTLIFLHGDEVLFLSPYFLVRLSKVATETVAELAWLLLLCAEPVFTIRRHASALALPICNTI